MIEPGLRGSTTVADRAVRRIAQRAATEALPRGEVEVLDASASVEGRRARVTVDVTLPYPATLTETGARVQQHLRKRTAWLTGLTVPEARVRVTGLAQPSAQGGLTRSQRPTTAESVVTPRLRARRPWSQRRLPVVALILLAACTCAALLADVVSVHLAHRSPSPWRGHLVTWLARHGPDDEVVAVCGAVAAVLGLWLIWLALTPGRRALVPASPPGGGVRVTLERPSVGALVREAVAGVEGVVRVTVRCGHRRVRVRTWVSFGDRSAAREAVRAAAGEALRGCGLIRSLRLRVSVRPAPHWRPPGQSPAPGAASLRPALSGNDTAPSTPETEAEESDPHGSEQVVRPERAADIGRTHWTGRSDPTEPNRSQSEGCQGTKEPAHAVSGTEDGTAGTDEEEKGEASDEQHP